MNANSMRTDREGMRTDADNCGESAKMRTVADKFRRMRTKPDADTMWTSADSPHTFGPLRTNNGAILKFVNHKP